MKKEWIPAAMLTLVCLILINGGYTGLLWCLARMSPQKGLGERIELANGRHYYANVAQRFTEDRYFWPRPSAVNFNGAGSGGSNKGPSNPDYLKAVSERIDSFLKHNPDIRRSDVPSELVTASGSGLDPDISLYAALVQAARVARSRGINEVGVEKLVLQQCNHSMFGIAPERVNVLRLNLALDQLK